MDSHDHFHIHIEQAPFSIQLLSPEGRTLAVNRAWKEMWQIPEAVIQNYILTEYNMAEDPQLEAKGVIDLIRRGLKGEVVEIPAIKYVPEDTEIQGDPRWVTGFMYPVKDKDGKLLEIVLTHRDITETKLAEEALRESRDQLEQAVKARDEFVSICSHELKTPITSIKLQFQVADRMLKTGDERIFTRENQEKRIKSTSSQLDRMVHLIDDMLDISRINIGKLDLNIASLNLQDLLKEVLGRFAEQFEASGIQLQTTITPDSYDMHGDRYRLEQVISNILSNGIKYGHGKPIEVRLSKSGTQCRIEVQDHGNGIAAADLERIFNRFERVSSTSNISGLGLGLYISKHIVSAHRGKIWAESKQGFGSTFIIELP